MAARRRAVSIMCLPPSLATSPSQDAISDRRMRMRLQIGFRQEEQPCYEDEQRGKVRIPKGAIAASMAPWTITVNIVPSRANRATRQDST